MAERPFSTASDVTILDLTEEQVIAFQSEVSPQDTEFARPDFSQPRIFVYDKNWRNATRIDRSYTDINGAAGDFHDKIRRA
jgi:hypothetical protein